MSPGPAVRVPECGGPGLLPAASPLWSTVITFIPQTLDEIFSWRPRLHPQAGCALEHRRLIRPLTVATALSGTAFVPLSFSFPARRSDSRAHPG